MEKNWVKKNEKLNTVEEVYLNNLGVNSFNDINTWFLMSSQDKYVIKGLDKAKELIDKFKDSTITIIGDYDVDGVLATTIIYLGLKFYGCKTINYRIPKRFSEGYGLKDNIIDEIEDGLIITVDNGISAIDTINKAKAKGLSVLVSDHHKPLVREGEIILPDADVIINPNAISGQAAFKQYCGAGLSFKLIKSLGLDKNILLPLESLAGIATVADVVTLKKENYVFVKHALDYINKGITLPSIRAICEVMGIVKLTSKDIGFKIAPLINACSRLYDNGAMEYAMDLMLEGNYQKALEKALFIKEINEQRKEMKTSACALADEMVINVNNEPIIIFLSDIGDGIIGLVAGYLAEKYKRPAIVFTNNVFDTATFKGSARSGTEFDMKKNLDKVSELMVNYGGHAGAAGLTIKADMFAIFKTAFIKQADPFVVDSNFYYDLSIDISKIDEVLSKLEALEPFGEGNPPIIFKIDGFKCDIVNNKLYETVGKTIKGLKFKSNELIAITFDEYDENKLEQLDTLTLYGQLAYYRYINRYEEEVSAPQIQFMDFYNTKKTRKATNFADMLAKKKKIS